MSDILFITLIGNDDKPIDYRENNVSKKNKEAYSFESRSNELSSLSRKLEDIKLSKSSDSPTFGAENFNYNGSSGDGSRSNGLSNKLNKTTSQAIDIPGKSNGSTKLLIKN